MISVVQTLCDRENFCELKALSISHAHIYLSLCLRLSPPLQNLRISLVVPPLPSVIDMRTSSATHYAGSSTINVDGEPAVHSEPPATLPTSGHVQKKVLVVCLDGTGDQVDADNSNVARFYSMLVKGHNEQQMVYYQAGIGTYTSPTYATPSPWLHKLSEWADKAVAWNLSNHVKQAYKFIMDYYKAGDKICLFGFSRGAYTARALAGMIKKVGLLPAGNDEQIHFAYKIYASDSPKSETLSADFKKAQCIDVTVEFLGVWDTVSSVGFFRGKELPFLKINTPVKVFRHALSLDERRVMFPQNTWHMTSANSIDNNINNTQGAVNTPEPTTNQAGGSTTPSSLQTFPSHGENEPGYAGSEEQLTGSQTPPDVKEVWFAGCHCDVGGGAVPNGQSTLAAISLRWMITECFRANTGIRFNPSLLEGIGLQFPGDSTGEAVTASEAVDISVKEGLDKKEVTQTPLHDRLVEKKWWWILEVLPMRHPVQSSDGKWRHKLTINRGKGRKITNGILVHQSVKDLYDEYKDSDRKYRPKARLVGGCYHTENGHGESINFP